MFLVLIIVAVVGIFFGLSGNNSALGISNGNGLFASVFAAAETNWSDGVGQFLVSYDDFKNIHKAVLNKNNDIKVFDIDGYPKENLMYASTDQGLFISRDGGLTWNSFTSSNYEINASSIIFKILPASSNGEDYFISVFSGGRGVVYRTYDYFFHLEKLIDFDNEAVYDMYQQGNSLYLAVSNGQIIHLNLKNGQSRVVNVFSSPVLKIYKPNGLGFYLLFKSGNIGKSQSLEGKFEKINLPGGGFFSSPKVSLLQFDSNGIMYVLNEEGIFKSLDGGGNYSLMKEIPIQKKTIDAMGLNNGKIYVVSDKKMFTSSDGGKNWKIDDLGNSFKISSFYFVNQRIIMSM